MDKTFMIETVLGPILIVLLVALLVYCVKEALTDTFGIRWFWDNLDFDRHAHWEMLVYILIIVMSCVLVFFAKISML